MSLHCQSGDKIVITEPVPEPTGAFSMLVFVKILTGNPQQSWAMATVEGVESTDWRQILWLTGYAGGKWATQFTIKTDGNTASSKSDGNVLSQDVWTCWYCSWDGDGLAPSDFSQALNDVDAGQGGGALTGTGNIDHGTMVCLGGRPFNADRDSVAKFAHACVIDRELTSQELTDISAGTMHPQELGDDLLWYESLASGSVPAGTTYGSPTIDDVDNPAMVDPPAPADPGAEPTYTAPNYSTGQHVGATRNRIWRIVGESRIDGTAWMKAYEEQVIKNFDEDEVELERLSACHYINVPEAGEEDEYNDPARVIDLRDPVTDTQLGSTTIGAVHAHLYSLGRQLMRDRDDRIIAAEVAEAEE